MAKEVDAWAVVDASENDAIDVAPFGLADMDALAIYLGREDAEKHCTLDPDSFRVVKVRIIVEEE